MICTSDVEITGIEISKGKILCRLTIFSPRKDRDNRLITETTVILHPEEDSSLQKKAEEIQEELESMINEFLTGIPGKSPVGIQMGTTKGDP